MYNINYVFIVGAVLVIALGQIIFKYAAGHLRIDALDETYYELLLRNVFPLSLVLVALVLYLMSTLAWVYALKTVPLSVAFLFNSLAFVLVPLAGFVLFGEQMPRYFLPGVLLIFSGIFLVSQG